MDMQTRALILSFLHCCYKQKWAKRGDVMLGSPTLGTDKHDGTLLLLF